MFLESFFVKTPLNYRLPKMGGCDTLIDPCIALDQETAENCFGSLLLARWVFVGVCAVSLDVKRGHSFPPFLSFSNLGTIEVRF